MNTKSARKPRRITPRDLDALDDLRSGCDNLLRVAGKDWVKPLDCGGSNGSDHSYRFGKLALMGYAEAKRHGGWSRGSKVYRITEAGRQLLAEHKTGATPPQGL